MKKSPSLLFCILMDGIGLLSFIIPYLGEFADIFWAPGSAIIFYASFGGKKGAAGAMFNFIEEVLPFLDFVPTFTLGWLYFHFVEKKTSQSIIKTRRFSTNTIDI